MKKIIIVVICIATICCGVAGFFYFRNKKENKDNTQKSEIILDNSVQNVNNTENLENTNSKVNISCVNANGWKSDNKNFEQYVITIENISNETLKDWNAEMDVSDDFEISQSWSGKYEIQNKKLIISPAEYNAEIKNGEKIELGFIAITNSKLNDNEIVIKSNNEIVGKNSNNNTEIKKQENSNENTELEKQENTSENVASDVQVTEPNRNSSEIANKNILKRIIKEGYISINMRIQGTPLKKYGRLAVNGTNLVDCRGNVVQLKGVSTHNISIFSQYINKETFKEMRDNWKIDVIRIAMYSNPNDGYSEELHSKVKEAVEYADELGLYVIIDWHILQDNNPNMYKGQAIQFFKEMATEFRDNNNVLYEICNEPNGNVTWKDDIKPYAQDVISEIRKIDKNAIIIVGTPNWSQDVDIVADDKIENYSNIMYTLHFYAATHKNSLRSKLEKAIQKGLPVFVTEFGICDASGNGAIDTNEANKWIELLNKFNISWVCWNLSNKNETSAILKSTCSKTEGFTEGDFSGEGIWLLGKLKE